MTRINKVLSTLLFKVLQRTCYRLEARLLPSLTIALLLLVTVEVSTVGESEPL